MRRWMVADVMTTNVVSVSVDAGYRDIVDLLAERRISAVPVVDEDRVVVGVVSEKDLLYKLEDDGAGGRGRRTSSRRGPRRKGDGTIARELMTSPALTIGREASLSAAARTMTDRGVKRLPVVDDGGVLAGIVARADLLKVHLRTDEELRREVVDEVLGRTLWLEPHVVHTHVDGGVVSLSGRLDRRSTADLAARLTGSVPGVVAVESHLTYEQDDPGMADARWYRSHPFSVTGP